MRGVSLSRSVCKSVSQERLERVDVHVVDFPNQTPIFKIPPFPVAKGETVGSWTSAFETTEFAEGRQVSDPRRRNSAREREREKMEHRKGERAKLLQRSREPKEERKEEEQTRARPHKRKDDGGPCLKPPPPQTKGRGFSSNSKIPPRSPPPLEREKPGDEDE